MDNVTVTITDADHGTYREDHDGVHISFTEREWAAMMSDPVYFGYACRAGHAIREDDLFFIHEGCPKCFQIGERGDDLYAACEAEGREPSPAEIKAFNRWADTLRDFPVIACGNCKETHVGVGAVRRCYANAGKFTA